LQSLNILKGSPVSSKLLMSKTLTGHSLWRKKFSTKLAEDGGTGVFLKFYND